MLGVLFEMTSDRTNALISGIFRRLPISERKCIQSSIAAVVDDDLPTAVRPFMFGGKIVRELCFDSHKLWFFLRAVDRKVGLNADSLKSKS